MLLVHCLLLLRLCGFSTQLQSSGLVAHENSTFRNIVLAVSVNFIGASLNIGLFLAY